MKQAISGRWFSRPEDERRTEAAWERFLSGSDQVPPAPRGLIGDSWLRCLSGHVDPQRLQAAPPLGEEPLSRLARRHARMISAGSPLVAQARDILAETGTVMLLADPRGTILRLEGDPGIRESLGEIRLVPGARWNEAACGTNAIGTALALGEPVQIHASEHYCAGIKRWTCSAAVIRDSVDGGILGVVDVSGLARSFSRHCLALAITTAQRIESQLAQVEVGRRLRMLERSLGRLTSISGDGVLVFDARGRLIQANEAASDALAARGVSGGVNTVASVPGLDRMAPREERAGLPSWLPRDGIEVVCEGGECLGSIVTLPRVFPHPTHHHPRAPEEPASKAFCRIVGACPELRAAVDRARRLAPTPVPVLLQGETGVGKELFARGIHRDGPNPDGPFVALNCGSLSRELLASELFGYGEGAFTGARRGGMIGKLESASGGTLFLDEIGEMPLELQPHLLRALEDGEIYRLGENISRKVSFRLVSATHRDLQAEVGAGRFRMDLFYRIAVTKIAIPPLRARHGDLAELVPALLKAFEQRNGVPAGTVSPDAMAALEQHSWPGNVRELRNVLASAALLAAGEQISRAHLPPELQAPRDANPTTPSGTLEDSERTQIDAALQDFNGNMSRAARALGISRSTLYLKLKRYGISAPDRSMRRGSPPGPDTHS